MHGFNSFFPIFQDVYISISEISVGKFWILRRFNAILSIGRSPRLLFTNIQDFKQFPNLSEETRAAQLEISSNYDS